MFAIKFRNKVYYCKEITDKKKDLPTKRKFFSRELQKEIKDAGDTTCNQVVQLMGRKYCVFCNTTQYGFEHFTGRQTKNGVTTWLCPNSAALTRINRGHEIIYRRKLLKHRENPITYPNPGPQATYITEHAFMLMKQKNPNLHIDLILYSPPDWLPDQNFYVLQVHRDDVASEKHFKAVTDKTVLEMYEDLEKDKKINYPSTNITNEDIAKSKDDVYYLSPWRMKERMDKEAQNAKRKTQASKLTSFEVEDLEKETKDPTKRTSARCQDLQAEIQNLETQNEKLQRELENVRRQLVDAKMQWQTPQDGCMELDQGVAPLAAELKTVSQESNSELEQLRAHLQKEYADKWRAEHLRLLRSCNHKFSLIIQKWTLPLRADSILGFLEKLGGQDFIDGLDDGSRGMIQEWFRSNSSCVEPIRLSPFKIQYGSWDDKNETQKRKRDVQTCEEQTGEGKRLKQQDKPEEETELGPEGNPKSTNQPHVSRLPDACPSQKTSSGSPLQLDFDNVILGGIDYAFGQPGINKPNT